MANQTHAKDEPFYQISVLRSALPIVQSQGLSLSKSTRQLQQTFNHLDEQNAMSPSAPSASSQPPAKFRNNHKPAAPFPRSATFSVSRPRYSSATNCHSRQGGCTRAAASYSIVPKVPCRTSKVQVQLLVVRCATHPSQFDPSSQAPQGMATDPSLP
jgi:hypothetical protein